MPEGEAGAICDGVLAISVTEIPRQDISLLDLIEKTGERGSFLDKQFIA